MCTLWRYDDRYLFDLYDRIIPSRESARSALRVWGLGQRAVLCQCKPDLLMSQSVHQSDGPTSFNQWGSRTSKHISPSILPPLLCFPSGGLDVFKFCSRHILSFVFHPQQFLPRRENTIYAHTSDVLDLSRLPRQPLTVHPQRQTVLFVSSAFISSGHTGGCVSLLPPIQSRDISVRWMQLTRQRQTKCSSFLFDEFLEPSGCQNLAAGS